MMTTCEVDPSTEFPPALQALRTRAARGELHLEDRLDLGGEQLPGRSVEVVSELTRLSASLAPPATAASQRGRLLTVDLRRNVLGPADALDIARATFVERLVSINLGATGLGDVGLEHFLTGRLTGLRHLAIWSNGIGPSGAAALAASPWWPTLDEVEMADNDLVDEGADLMAAARSTGLARLDLQWNGIGPDAAARLGRGLPDTTIVLWDNKIREDDADELRIIFPHLRFPRWRRMDEPVAATRPNP